VVDLLLAVLHGSLVETEDAVDGERIRRPAVRLRAVFALRRRSGLHGLELDGLRTRELRARHGEAVRDPTHDAAIAEHEEAVVVTGRRAAGGMRRHLDRHLAARWDGHGRRDVDARARARDLRQERDRPPAGPTA